MLEIKNKCQCSGCSACFNACPKNCVEMKEDGEGFLYPCIDKTKCINCGLCVRSCPILNKQKPKQEVFRTFACINKDETIRLKSSSGGVFSALAEHVLEQNGVVFGAGFDKDFMVCHQHITSKDQLDVLRTSKYVQSSIGDSFKKAKQFLDEGKLVLFSGTACQIAGLKSFLKKDYPLLVTQDLICHGAPSPLVWRKYVELKSKEKGLKISNICFRDKSSGWKTYSVAMNFEDSENSTTYKKCFKNEPYMNMFIFNKILRPSCHNCSFKGTARLADITLADFWGSGFKKYAPHMNDNKGCSLVIAHSQKGQELLDALSDKLDCVEVPPTAALRGNGMARKSALKNPRRTALMKALGKMPFDKFVKKYGKILF